MVSINITMPEYKPLDRLVGPGYMTFSLPYNQETAVRQFKDRHGFTPKEVKEHKGNLMLGPVPEDEIPWQWGPSNRSEVSDG